jgi:3-hydroxymyristoyl/3-hydroxydecanoyl-(acyl carrier protein) dehydratase
MELPDLIAETWHQDNHVSLQFALEPEQSCFRGHFDGAPVLAGVIQLGWVMGFAEQKFHCPWQFRGLNSAKFQRLILPPVELQLDIEYLPQRQLLKFSYRDAEGTYSSGAVQVASGDE